MLLAAFLVRIGLCRKVLSCGAPALFEGAGAGPSRGPRGPGKAVKNKNRLARDAATTLV